jgi:3-phosphoglycerate kinase
MLQKATLSHIAKYLDSSSQVLIRTDFNVPIKENKIKDATRIDGNIFFYLATLPTLRKVLDSNPKSLVMLSHLGRP